MMHFHALSSSQSRRLACALLVLCGLSIHAAPARGETSSTCTGFIDTVPAVISGQGVWCLRRDLSTNLGSGAAIQINTNNVTIDCNGFKIGGLAAGDTSAARGIHAYNRRNITVRNCSIRGFHTGIDLTGGVGTQDNSSGHLVEHNRLDNNLRRGIQVSPGKRHLVRGNSIFDTGGAPGETSATGISASGDVIDNVVSGLFATAANTYPRGIDTTAGSVVRGNVVSGFVVSGSGQAQGIVLLGDGGRISGNSLSLNPAGSGRGLWAGGAGTYCLGNTLSGFSTPVDSCLFLPGDNHAQ